jgi:hypothetical protein
MKKYLLLIASAFPTLAFSQITLIPDLNFEQHLINIGVDDVIDGTVLTSNIDTVSALYMESMNISSLSGIEDFLALEELWCAGNSISTLDISQNALLRMFDCDNNLLTTLDVSNNTLLEWFNFDSNNISNIDISNNYLIKQFAPGDNPILTLEVNHLDSLHYLYANNTAITELDLSHNSMLRYCYLDNNNLNCLNLKNGANDSLYINASNNPNLNCVEVDDSVYAINNWSAYFDSAVSFSYNCNNNCSSLINSINNINHDSLTIYPNPSNGKYFLDFGTSFDSVSINVIDINGKIIVNEKFANSTIYNFELNAPQGVYVLFVETANSRTILRLVKH